MYIPRIANKTPIIPTIFRNRMAIPFCFCIIIVKIKEANIGSQKLISLIIECINKILSALLLFPTSKPKLIEFSVISNKAPKKLNAKQIPISLTFNDLKCKNNPIQEPIQEKIKIVSKA